MLYPNTFVLEIVLERCRKKQTAVLVTAVFCFHVLLRFGADAEFVPRCPAAAGDGLLFVTRADAPDIGRAGL